MVEFIAVIKEVKAKSLVSLDKSVRVIVETDDLSVLRICDWMGGKTVKVRIEEDGTTKG